VYKDAQYVCITRCNSSKLVLCHQSLRAKQNSFLWDLRFPLWCESAVVHPKCDISGSHGGEYEYESILGCRAV
jgi:hypothetical protein